MFKFLSNKRVFFKPTFSFHIHSNYESTYVYPQGENFVGTKSLDCIDDKNILQSRTGKIKFKLHFKREHLCFLFQYKSTSFHHKFLIFIWLQQELFPTDRNRLYLSTCLLGFPLCLGCSMSSMFPLCPSTCLLVFPLCPGQIVITCGLWDRESRELDRRPRGPKARVSSKTHFSPKMKIFSSATNFQFSYSNIYIYYFTLHYLKQSSHSFILTIKRVFIWRRATPLGRASLSKRAGFHLAFTWEKPTLAQPSHPG